MPPSDVCDRMKPGTPDETKPKGVGAVNHIRPSAGRALLVGVASTLWHLPPLLRRAGLNVESITVRSPYFRLPGARRGALSAPTLTGALELAAERASLQPYDLVVTSDDTALRLLRDWDGLTLEQRLLLAPVLSAGDLEHLASKIAMIKRLDAAGVHVPRWREASDLTAAEAAASDLGWPIVLKNDYGAGGRGVRVVSDRVQLGQVWADLQRAWAREEARLPLGTRRPRRVLVQKYAPGRDVDLSAFFRSSQLVHFTYSLAIETLTNRGACSLRHYLPTYRAGPSVVDELATIGQALGLDGFANISAREPSDSGARAYFEVDARPNLWAHVGAQVGDDPGSRLSRWFATGEADVSPTATAGRLNPRGCVVRMTHRSSRRQLLRNADGALTSMPWGTPDAALVLGSALLRGPVLRE